MRFTRSILHRSVALAIALTMFVGCARSDRAILDQSQALIDQRKYSEAIELLEKEMSAHANPELKTELAFAYLGRSGVELPALAAQINIFKSFNSVEIPDDTVHTVCPSTVNQQPRDTIPLVCLPILKFDHFPDPDQPDFKRSLDLFYANNPDPKLTSNDINLLLAVLELGSAIKNYDHLAEVVTQLESGMHKGGEPIQLSVASSSFKYLKGTLNSVFKAAHRLMFSYAKIRKYVDQYKNKPLLRLGHHTYTASDSFSGEDFLHFLLTSTRDEATRLNNNSSPANLDALSQGLTASLSTLSQYLNVPGQDTSFIMEKVLQQGAHWIPESEMSVHPKLDFDFYHPSVLPKMLQRFSDAAKKSWTEEDATFISGAFIDLDVQTQAMNTIAQNWQIFWSELGTNGSNELKAHASAFTQRIPKAVSAEMLQDWYVKVSESLHHFPEGLSSADLHDPLLNNFSNLVNQSERWIAINLW